MGAKGLVMMMMKTLVSLVKAPVEWLRSEQEISKEAYIDNDDGDTRRCHCLMITKRAADDES